MSETTIGSSALHIGLQYHAPDASLPGRRRQSRAFRGAPVIASMHDYLGRDSTRYHRSKPDNAALDQGRIHQQHDQIFLVLSGHVGRQGLTIPTNRAGHQLHQRMVDYQGRSQTARFEKIRVRRHH